MNKKQILNHLLLGIALMGLSVSNIAAQQKLQVVTKTIKKTFSWAEGERLNILGEMADVTVIPSDDAGNVTIELKLISKHSSIEQAREDVNKLQYIAAKHSGVLFVRDYVANDKSESKPQATLKALITIYAPKNCPVNAQSTFGNINVSGMRSGINVNGEFCSIKVDNVQGDVCINANYGQIETDNIRGSLSINTIRANTNIGNTRGRAAVTADYAEVKVNAGENLSSMNIVASYSDVLFNDNMNADYNFSLTTNNGKILHPSSMKFKIQKDETKRLATYTASADSPVVNIMTTHGDIIIDK